MKRLATAILAVFLSASSAAAYYHYVHYTNRSTPYFPILEKFDLNALPNRTVTFMAAGEAPSAFVPGDNFASVLSQIRQAAQAWNSVETSELRVVFGGLYSPGMPQSTPGGEIVFDELPPGALGFGGPTSRSELSFGPNGPFVPITRAVVRMNRDLTRRPGPSYTESFFTTLVHEMGHAIGLQHAATSGAMNIALNRSTFRLRPLEADDIAGISLLYPSGDFFESTGTISGRVTSGGQGIHLASVVAIRPDGSAVSALTNPDGTYRIQGLPADQYLVYVHPLPEATQDGLGPGDIELPVSPDGRYVPADGPIETLFYPGTREPSQAVPVTALRGGLVENIDFSVQRRAAVPIFDVEVFGYFGAQATKPAFLNAFQSTGTIVARGVGLTQGNAAAPGLRVQVLSGSPASVRAYGNPANLAVDLNLSLFAGLGPRHIVFSTQNDVYVLPSAVHLVQKPPPAVTGIFAGSNGTVTILGTNFGEDSRFYFDGVPGIVRSVNGSDAESVAAVLPPAGAGNQAIVTVYNADGQNSTFLQAQSLPTFSYEAAEPPQIQLEPSALPAGVDSVVEVTGFNTRFTEGETVLGFGTNDILVRRIWVVSPTKLLASVSVAPGAFPAAALVSVLNGFQVITQPFGFQVLPRNAQGPWLSGEVLNTNALQSAIHPGSTVLLTGRNLTTNSGGTTTTVTVGDQPAAVVFAASIQVAIRIPAGVPPGPALLRLSNGVASGYPIVVQIDPPPPVISALTRADRSAVQSAHAGDLINLSFRDPLCEGSLDPERLRVNVGGRQLTPVNVSVDSGDPGLFNVQWVLPSSVEPGAVAVSVEIGNRVSGSVLISVVRVDT